MIVDLYKSGMSLADLSSQDGIAKSTMNGWIKDVKEIKVDENEELKLAIKGWYNRKRLHSSINYMTPDQCELLARCVA